MPGQCRGLPHHARSHLQIVEDILREQTLGTTLQRNVLCWQQLEGNGVGEAPAFMENMQVTRACREQSRWRGRHRGGEPGAAGRTEQREGPGSRQRQKGPGRSEPGGAAGSDGGLAHGGAWRGPVTCHWPPSGRKCCCAGPTSWKEPWQILFKCGAPSLTPGREALVEGLCSAVLSMGRPLASLDGTEPSVPVHCQASLRDHTVLMLGLRSRSCSPCCFQDGLR